jgi:hypothetical protein
VKQRRWQIPLAGAAGGLAILLSRTGIPAHGLVTLTILIVCGVLIFLPDSGARRVESQQAHWIGAAIFAGIGLFCLCGAVFASNWPALIPGGAALAVAGYVAWRAGTAA